MKNVYAKNNNKCFDLNGCTEQQSASAQLNECKDQLLYYSHFLMITIIFCRGKWDRYKGSAKYRWAAPSTKRELEKKETKNPILTIMTSTYRSFLYCNSHHIEKRQMVFSYSVSMRGAGVADKVAPSPKKRIQFFFLLLPPPLCTTHTVLPYLFIHYYFP